MNKALLILVMIFSLASCKTREYVYHNFDIDTVEVITESGTKIVTENKSTEGAILGMIGGAVAGGTVGNKKNSETAVAGSLLGAVAGGVAGGAGGSMVETQKEVSYRNIYYRITLKDSGAILDFNEKLDCICNDPHSSFSTHYFYKPEEKIVVRRTWDYPPETN